MKPMSKPTYSMSSTGWCSRTLSAEKLGVFVRSQPEYLKLAAREGQRHEQWIKEDLEEHGWLSTTIAQSPYCGRCGRSGIHVEIDTKNILLVGHMDDIAMPHNNPTDVHFGEYKALGKNTSTLLNLKGVHNHRTYATQIVCYHKASHLPCLYVVKSRDTGKMTLKIFDDTNMPFDFDDVLERLTIIEDYVQSGELVPCDADKEGITDYSCTGLCDEGDLVKIKDLDGIAPESLKQAVSQWKTAKALEEVSNSMNNESRSIFKAYMGSIAAKSIGLDGVRIAKIADGERTVYEVPEEVQARMEEMKQEYKVKVHRPGYIRVMEVRE